MALHPQSLISSTRHHRFILCVFLWVASLADISGLNAQQAEKTDTIVPQRDLIDVVSEIFKPGERQVTESDKKVSFSLIPIAGASAPSGKVAVSSINAAFYLGDPTVTNLSNIFFIPYTNFSNQFGLIFRPTLWSNRNEWNFTGELRFSSNDFNTWGLGSGSSPDIQSVLNVELFRFYGSANHRILGNFFAGMGYNLDYFFNLTEKDKQVEVTDLQTYGIGTSGSSLSSGLAFNLLRDSRKNSLNPTNGFYSNFSYKYSSPVLGSTYTWSSVIVDLRKYIPFRYDRHSTMAFWVMYWGTYGDVPYLNLPGTAQDLGGRTGRGYKYGRYRGKQMLYAEAEYRFDLSRNGFWGGVVFGNVQSFTGVEEQKFQNLRPAAGLGLRLKFNKKSDSNITLDFAWGHESFNWHLNLGEYF